MAEKNTNRDGFSQATVLQIAKRAGWLCSFPECRASTVGATSDGESEINIGTAAHICAASPGGPRYDKEMSRKERTSAKNGIWMCRDHGKAIDSKDPKFTVELLRAWKKQAEYESWQRVLRSEVTCGPRIAIDAELQTRIRSAAKADLEVFRRTAKWPSTSVALTLKVDGYDEPIATNALAGVVSLLDDLILVAPPGMGKTTTLFQIADSLLTSGRVAPLMVQLGDWATEDVPVLESILKRPALRGISESEFRKAAERPGVAILLDGWNELDSEARKRARVQVANLKAELPELGLVVSTRRQALDVPFQGVRAELLPLNEEQQKSIAIAIRGDSGVHLVDQAWRTAGVRELVSIPLYLTALLSLPEGGPFPTTKEEVLRHFVYAHQRDVSREEALYGVTRGFHQEYLNGLASIATFTANTAIADSNARRSIFETSKLLTDNRQITTSPEPEAVLDVLVSNHVLTRVGDTPGYSFQHQQIQEWYASHAVERRIISEVNDPKNCMALKAEVLNLPVWEEAILFAIERLARGDAHRRAACGKAIIASFEVDPIFAAEMIFRSTEEVWEQIATPIRDLVVQWHATGKVDRALRFMLTSGRFEFFDWVWPLITNENEKISLKALRNCRTFRPSILGKDAEKRIRMLSQSARKVLLYEMASRSGMDGLDLASAIAKDDPDPEVQAFVVDALAFRRADRHVALVLRKAPDKTFDLIVSKGLVDQVDDEHVKQRLADARGRQIAQAPDYHRLRVILYAQDGKDRSAELTDVISSMQIERQQDAPVQLIYETFKRYPRAVSNGLLARVFAGRTLFFRADDILASGGFSLEDDLLCQLALAETPGHDDRAVAAASVLGPKSVGLLIDALEELEPRLRDADGKFDKTVSDRYRQIQERIAHVSGSNLVAAVKARSSQADNDQMARLSELLSRHPKDKDRGRPFNDEDCEAIRVLFKDWANRMLSSSSVERRQMLRVVELASHAPDVTLLPLLKRMLDENIRRYKGFREEAEAGGWRPGNAVNEAQWPMMHEYQRAFQAIPAPETNALMRVYLADPFFGECAARVLASQWNAANEPPLSERIFGGVDFRRVKERRYARAIDPGATSAEAEAIFTVIESQIADGATDDQKKHAVTLGVVAVSLPHGMREETISKLIAMSPRRVRSKLLLSLILSGAEVDSELVANGVAETLEAAKKERWILSEGGYELREWLRLLPFTNRPSDILNIVRTIPELQRRPDFLEELVRGLSETPSEGGEEVLFKLAEQNPLFYQNHAWRSAVLNLGTESAAICLIDLTANGIFQDKSVNAWHWSDNLAGLITQFPKVRRYVYDLLKVGVTSQHFTLLSRAVSNSLDSEGLLLLIEIEKTGKPPHLGWHSIEKCVTEHIPDEDWNGAYNIVPIPAIELRQKLLTMTTDGGPMDIAASWLNIIDAIRDEYGSPISEPRHPYLASGKPWPMMSPDPHASAE